MKTKFLKKHISESQYLLLDFAGCLLVYFLLWRFLYKMQTMDNIGVNALIVIGCIIYYIIFHKLIGFYRNIINKPLGESVITIFKINFIEMIILELIFEFGKYYYKYLFFFPKSSIILFFMVITLFEIFVRFLLD